MTLSELLAELDARDVKIEVVDGKLRVDAPVNAVSAELRAALAEHKAALLAREKGADAPMRPCAPFAPTSTETSVPYGIFDMRIPLDEQVCGDFLARHKLRIVDGMAYPDGRNYPPTIYLVDDAH